MELKSPAKEALEVWVDGERTVVAGGGSLEVTGDAAKSLQAQGWTRPAAKPKKTRAKKAPPETPADTKSAADTKDGE